MNILFKQPPNEDLVPLVRLCQPSCALQRSLCGSPFYKAERVLSLWALKWEKISADEMNPRLMWTLKPARHKAIAPVFMKCAIMRLWRHLNKVHEANSCGCLLILASAVHKKCCNGSLKLSHHLNVEYKFRWESLSCSTITSSLTHTHTGSIHRVCWQTFKDGSNALPRLFTKWWYSNETIFWSASCFRTTEVFQTSVCRTVAIIKIKTLVWKATFCKENYDK